MNINRMMSASQPSSAVAKGNTDKTRFNMNMCNDNDALLVDPNLSTVAVPQSEGDRVMTNLGDGGASSSSAAHHVSGGRGARDVAIDGSLLTKIYPQETLTSTAMLSAAGDVCRNKEDSATKCCTTPELRRNLSLNTDVDQVLEMDGHLSDWVSQPVHPNFFTHN